MRTLEGYENPVSQTRLVRMHGRKGLGRNALHQERRWKTAVRLIGDYNDAMPLELDLN
jgi:hypothetical protein